MLPETIMRVLPFFVVLAFSYWVFQLGASQKRGERMVLKWRELSRGKRMFGLLVLTLMGFNLYLIVAMVAMMVGKVVLPFGGLDRSVIAWSFALSLAGPLGYLVTLTHPRRRVAQADLS